MGGNPATDTTDPERLKPMGTTGNSEMDAVFDRQEAAIVATETAMQALLAAEGRIGPMVAEAQAALDRGASAAEPLAAIHAARAEADRLYLDLQRRRGEMATATAEVVRIEEAHAIVKNHAARQRLAEMGG